jgi:shikimate kinase
MDAHLFITGFMGSGKSTIGRKLAAHLRVPFIDIDDKIEKQRGQSIKDIFNSHGESYFREIEQEELLRQCDCKQKAVISLGGGALISEISRDAILKCGILVYIESSPENIWRRTHHSNRRPLMPRSDSPEDSVQKIRELMAQRIGGYQAAHLKINRDHMEADEVVQILIEKLRTFRRSNDGQK